MAAVVNKRLVAIVGKPGMGKSASLRDLEDQEGVVYINAESGKDIPFRHKFREEVVTDPEEVFDIIAEAEDDESVHTVVIDSITMLMEMYESVHIVGSKDSRAKWGDYNQFFKNLMQQYIAPSRLRFILVAHVDEVLNEETGIVESRIPVKGALAKIGLAAFFSIIVEAKKVPTKKLKEYNNELLDVTKRDNDIGYKHVFQTLPTKETIGSIVRGPFDLFDPTETFIDNNAQMLLEAIDEFYAP